MPQSPTNAALWQAIQQHPLDNINAAFPFSKRLARDNKWSLEFSLGVINEYKKFIYLCCISQRALTPSDEVDQAWHLHLTYSRDYWEVFCSKVLGRSLHHGPTRGGQQEIEKYAQCYDRTLMLYEEEFSCAPPTKYWPVATERFGKAPYYTRINSKTHWIIPKPNQQQRYVAGVAALVMVIVAGCDYTNANDDTEFSGLDNFAIIMSVIILFALVSDILGFNKKRKKRKGNKKDGSGCSSGCGGHYDYDSSDDGGGGCSGCGGCGGCG